MAKSLNINFAYNLVNNITGLLFPLITFPYISRVLMVDGIGQIQFYQSIINYIALITALGIPLYAVKQISKNNNSNVERNQNLIEILCIYLCFTIIGYIIVGVLLGTVDVINANWDLFLLLSIHLILVALGSEWFYQGIEDFKYISIRSFVVKFLSVVCLFIFVRERSDLYVYALLLVLAEAGNNLFNFLHLRKYINFKKIHFRELNFKRHIGPAFKMFFLNILISIYVNLDSIMLGFIVGTTAVGLYTAATRLTRAICGFSSALGGVLLPRLTSYYSLGKMDEFNSISNLALSFIIVITFPMVVGLILTAPQLVPIFAGSSYGPSILTLQIIAPLVLFLGLSGILGTKILYAQDKENIVIKSISLGALINLILNLVLIPIYKQDGAAISSVFAEFVVTASMMIKGRKYISYQLINKETLQVIIYTAIMSIPVIILQHSNYSIYLKLTLQVISALFVYTTCLILCKNRFVKLFLSLFTPKIIKK